MAVVDLVLIVGWLVMVAGIPGYRQYRRTGRGAIRVADQRGSSQWWARSISSLGFGLLVAAPIADLLGLPPIAPLANAFTAAVGVGLVVLGTVITVTSQAAMGASWRADVDPDARIDLVTTGPFRLVRNPILSGTAVATVGFALIVPNVLALAMLVAVALGLEIQVRLVEEPYLLRVHGDAYRRYAARTGRFIPGIGRLPESVSRPVP